MHSCIYFLIGRRCSTHINRTDFFAQIALNALCCINFRITESKLAAFPSDALLRAALHASATTGTFVYVDCKHFSVTIYWHAANALLRYCIERSRRSVSRSFTVAKSVGTSATCASALNSATAQFESPYSESRNASLF